MLAIEAAQAGREETPMMKRIALACAVAAVSCAILGTELSAQSSQAVTPAPSTSEPVPHRLLRHRVDNHRCNKPIVMSIATLMQ